MKIAFRSTEHKNRFIAAMQQIGKLDEDIVDKEYGTALYLLTFDQDIWELAKKYVSQSGIRFDQILGKNVFSSGEATLIKLAANLFYSQLNTIYPEPVEIVWMGESYFRLAINALNLRYYGIGLSDLQ